MCSAPSDPRRRSSLVHRIAGWYVLALIVTVGGLIAIAVPALRAAVDREQQLVMESTVERHAAMLSRTGLPGYRDAVEGSAQLGSGDVAVRVRDAAGATVFEHGNVAASIHIASRATRELRIDLGQPDDPWAALVRRLRPGVVALFVIALLLAVGGGFYVTRRALRPIRLLAATARDVAVSGDLSRRVPERGGADELDELAVLFNRMLERNQNLVRAMRESLDNVAHDLRTPLTRLRGVAELALRNGDPEAAREALSDAIEESERVLAMLRTLMDISEADAGLMRLKVERTSLRRLAAETVELYAHVAEEAGVELVLVSGADVVALVDPSRMRQAIANLVDNAVKYTGRGGRVELGIGADGDRAVVRVRDTGEGIAAEAIPRIWDRLYRADPSRSRSGLGLGLSLVRAIAHAHGGDVSVESQPARGSVFTIRVPLAQAARAVEPGDERAGGRNVRSLILADHGRT